jgi:glycine/D-amino acid oxidase-like deaminating enzyme
VGVQTSDHKRLPGRAQSLWLADRPRPSFPVLEKDLHVDVAIVGAGITGLSAGVALAEAGRRVAVVDQQQVGGGETGHTTGHLTEVLDTRYSTLKSRLGREAAQLIAEGTRAAIALCEERVRKHRIRCGFVRLPAFLFTEEPTDVPELYEEMAAMAAIGCHAGWTNEVPLPFPTAGGIWVQNQAQMDAYSYCLGLASTLMKAEGQVFEFIRVTGIHQGEPCVVETAEGSTLRAESVIVAGHVPISNRVMLHTNVAAYRSYALAAPIDAALPALFFDTAQPYHYLRTHAVDQAVYLAVGGEDHRAGAVEEGEGAFSRLEAYLNKRFAEAPRVKYRWSGQVIESVDGLPYIGPNSPDSRVYVATGYAGNGLTFGTLAGTILCDQILARPNPLAALYDTSRLPALVDSGPSGA